jgi:hypothetical protein
MNIDNQNISEPVLLNIEDFSKELLQAVDPFHTFEDILLNDADQVSQLGIHIASLSNDLDGLQNVQRLDGSQAEATPSLVFGNMITHDYEILNIRHQILSDSGEFPPGQSKVLAQYRSLSKLDTLSKYQFEWCFGLILGDASVESSLLKKPDESQTRLKIQQTPKNLSLLDFTKLVLLPYVNKVVQPSAQERPNMYELVTIKHKAFNELGELFKQKQEIVNNKTFNFKSIPEKIEDYLTPLVLGSWYCCDGGRRDYGKNEGKASQLHTQGFSFEDCKKLAMLYAKLQPPV